MNVKEAIFKRRSIRKFTQERVSRGVLEELIGCARMAAYGANMQPLKFKMITDEAELADIFPLIKWAAYLEDGAPKEGERPTAYIAVLGDLDIKSSGAFETDAGAAVTNMMLEAVEKGYATCWLGAIDREAITKRLNLSENLKLLYLLAVGKPMQESKIVDMENDSVKYYLDDNGVMNVPKRALDDIII